MVATRRPPGGGSSPTVIDLGVVNIAALLNGPQTIYTPAAGEFVLLAFGDSGFVAQDGDQIATFGFTADLTGSQFARGEFSWAGGVGLLQLRNASGSQPHGKIRDGSPMVAIMETGVDNYLVESLPPAWQANHSYAGSDAHPPGGEEGAAGTLILGPDSHIWSSTKGASGVSAGTIPAFSAHHGGTVVDGTVTWTDQGAVPTTGALHLYAVVGIAAASTQTTFIQSVQISSAEIKQLHGSPKQILAAPGGRKYFFVTRVILHYRFVTTPYSGTFRPVLGFGSPIDYNNGIYMPFAVNNGATFIPNKMLQQTQDSYFWEFSPVYAWLESEIENTPVTIGNANTDVTLGDGTMTARIFYSLIDGAP